MVRLTGVLMVIFLLAGCMSIPLGDEGKIKLSKDGLEVEDKEGEKVSISVDGENGGSTIEFEDGSSASTGSNATVPDLFPKEILLPADGQLLQSVENESDGRPSYLLSYTVQGDMKKDAEIYHTYLTDNDYEVHEIAMADTVFAYQGRKTSHYLHYQLMGDHDEQEYMITISYGELENE